MRIYAAVSVFQEISPSPVIAFAILVSVLSTYLKMKMLHPVYALVRILIVAKTSNNLATLDLVTVVYQHFAYMAVEGYNFTAI